MSPFSLRSLLALVLFSMTLAVGSVACVGEVSPTPDGELDPSDGPDAGVSEDPGDDGSQLSPQRGRTTSTSSNHPLLD